MSFKDIFKKSFLSCFVFRNRNQFYLYIVTLFEKVDILNSEL